jgi:hypothetical protein
MMRELFWAAAAAAVVTSSAWFPLVAHAGTHADPVNICGALRDGISLGNIESALESTGMGATAAGAYAGTVIRTQCPDLIGLAMGQLA